MQIPRFSKSEKEIMSVLWAEGRPLSSAEIIELSPDKTWKSNSIHVILNNLLDKGAVRVAGVAVRGKYASRTFEATFSESDGAIRDIRNSNSFKKGSFRVMKEVLCSLAEEMELTDEQYDELCDILRKNKTK